METLHSVIVTLCLVYLYSGLFLNTISSVHSVLLTLLFVCVNDLISIRSSLWCTAHFLSVLSADKIRADDINAGTNPAFFHMVCL